MARLITYEEDELISNQDLLVGVDSNDSNNTKLYKLDLLKNFIRGYKVYSAILNQSGTNAPVATILENTIGDIVWTRNSSGTYYGTLAAAFPSAKYITQMPISGFDSYVFDGGGGDPYWYYRNNSDSVVLLCNNDNILQNTPVEIRVAL